MSHDGNIEKGRRGEIAGMRRCSGEVPDETVMEFSPPTRKRLNGKGGSESTGELPSPNRSSHQKKKGHFVHTMNLTSSHQWLTCTATKFFTSQFTSKEKMGVTADASQRICRPHIPGSLNLDAFPSLNLSINKTTRSLPFQLNQSTSKLD
uniref:Uncharacterized protein n=1 Tax=Oryza punctata TaxID=4537 RepID=A0A0E0JV36_ORYPU